MPASEDARQRKRARQRTPEYRARKREREGAPEYRAKAVIRQQRYDATSKGYRARLRAQMKALTSAHEHDDEKLEAIFAEANALLVP